MAGRYGDAIDRLRSTVDRPGLQESDVTFLLPILAEALLHTDLREAKEVSERATKRAREQHDTVALVDAIYVSALVAMEENQFEQARLQMNELLALSRSMAYPFAEAQALLGIAEIDVKVTGEVNAAGAEVLEEAGAIFSRLGAEVYIRRVEQIRWDTKKVS